jgi:hypothetical protein
MRIAKFWSKATRYQYIYAGHRPGRPRDAAVAPEFAHTGGHYLDDAREAHTVPDLFENSHGVKQWAIDPDTAQQTVDGLARPHRPARHAIARAHCIKPSPSSTSANERREQVRFAAPSPDPWRSVPSAPSDAAGGEWRGGADVPGVGRTYQHANREVLIEGGPLPVRLHRSPVRKTAQ